MDKIVLTVVLHGARSTCSCFGYNGGQVSNGQWSKILQFILLFFLGDLTSIQRFFLKEGCPRDVGPLKSHRGLSGWSLELGTRLPVQ